MDKIKNYNCDGLCVHQYCSERYTRCTTQTINGMKIFLGFCDKHAQEFEDAEIKKLREKR